MLSLQQACRCWRTMHGVRAVLMRVLSYARLGGNYVDSFQLYKSVFMLLQHLVQQIHGLDCL